MKTDAIYRSSVIGLIFLCLLSCSQRPELEAVMLPTISKTDVSADVTQIVLSAELSGRYELVSECGFLFGKKGSDMERITSEREEDDFSAVICDFEFDVEYSFMAFASNGRNEVQSGMRTFRTPAKPVTPEPDTPDKPEDPDEPENPEPDIPDVPVKPEPVYTLGVDKTVIEASVGAGKYNVSIYGNAEFEILVPDEIDWLSLHSVSYSGRRCTLKVALNDSGLSRSCEVQFRSLSHDCVATVHLIQEGCATLVVDATHGEHAYIGDMAPYVGDVKTLERCDTYDWLHGEDTGVYLNGILGIAMSRNDTYASRSAYFFVHGTQGSVLVHLVQHSYLDIIEFECPVMKQLCVEHWDANGDGELSYFEVEKVTIDKSLNFSRKDFTSFKEFKYFTSVNHIPQYLFAESDIAGIEFNGGVRGSGYISVKEGAFMNCTGLNGLHAYCFYVQEKAFMGCSSLEKIYLAGPGVPANAFTGCTSLKTVVFEGDDNNDSAVIGSQAFKDCTSLTEIDIPMGVTQIHDSAFAGCTSLRTVRLTSGTPPTLAPTAFSGTSAELRFIVPPPVLQVYKKAWPEFAGQIVGE